MFVFCLFIKALDADFGSRCGSQTPTILFKIVCPCVYACVCEKSGSSIHLIREFKLVKIQYDSRVSGLGLVVGEH